MTPADSTKPRSETPLLFIIALSAFSVPFMTSGLTVALPTIGRELDISAITLSWVISSFQLSSAIFIVPMGRLGDILGRRTIFISGILIFSCASMTAAFATSAPMLIAARALQGFGGSMMFGTEAAIISTAFPVGRRGRALGTMTFMVFLGLTIGPYIGGLLTQHPGWRSIFLINVALWLSVAVLMLTRFKGRWAGAAQQQFDLIGSAIYILGVGPLIYGFTLLPAARGIGLMLTGLLLLGIFTVFEWRQPSPALNVRLFHYNRAFAFSSLATLFTFGATFPSSFVMSLYLQYVKGFPPEQAGLILLAMPAMQALVSPLGGRLSDRFPPRLPAAAGGAFCAAGVLALAFISEASSLGQIITGLLLIGFGVAFFAAPNINAIMSSVSAGDYGVASAVTATMRSVGIAFGLGIVMLLISFYLGSAQVTPENYPALIQTARLTFIIFGGICAVGVGASLAQGK